MSELEHDLCRKIIQNQTVGTTQHDRYPEIMARVRDKVTGQGLRVLSFGCSTGEEVTTLEGYFDECTVHGYDIDPSRVPDSIGHYSEYKELLPYSYDVVFCMSVLCRWPEPQKPDYKFDLFETTLETIHRLIRPAGHLVIYNASYTFTDSALSSNYVPVNLNLKDSGFVTRRTSAGVVDTTPTHVLYKRRTK